MRVKASGLEDPDPGGWAPRVSLYPQALTQAFEDADAWEAESDCFSFQILLPMLPAT